MCFVPVVHTGTHEARTQSPILQRRKLRQKVTCPSSHSWGTVEAGFQALCAPSLDLIPLPTFSDLYCFINIQSGWCCLQG